MNPTPNAPGRTRRGDLLSSEELAALGGLEVLVEAVVEGFFMGLHRSPHRGFSAEFAELRGYQPGDEIRHIDWRMYARSDRFYVKQFEDETNLRAYILLDVSASMGWSSRPGSLPTKLWYGRTLAAALTHLLLRQGDRAGLALFDDRIRGWLAARGGRRQWVEALRRLESLEASGTTDASSALKEVALRLRRRGLVLLISDLLVDPEQTLRALKFLRHQGHQVVVFHLFDPGERDLTGTGDARFRDPETGEDLVVDVSDVRKEYREAVDRAVEEWRGRLRPAGIEYEVLDTAGAMGPGLRAFLRKRERMS
ncbi:MAG: DUF58 domain-containing protein [Gemmatimonadota bacterium]